MDKNILIRKDYILGGTLLHHACLCRMENLALKLITILPLYAIKYTDFSNSTPLHYACKNNMRSVANRLFKLYGEESIELKDSYGYTALDYAIESRFILSE